MAAEAGMEKAAVRCGAVHAHVRRLAIHAWSSPCSLCRTATACTLWEAHLEELLPYLLANVGVLDALSAAVQAQREAEAAAAEASCAAAAAELAALQAAVAAGGAAGSFAGVATVTADGPQRRRRRRRRRGCTGRPALPRWEFLCCLLGAVQQRCRRRAHWTLAPPPPRVTRGGACGMRAWEADGHLQARPRP